MSQFKSLFVLIFASFVFTTAHADLIRWTAAEDKNPALKNVLSIIQSKTGKSFSESDFLLSENRDLAFNHYQRFEQLSAGVPVQGSSIRVWSDANGETVQVEASLDLSLAQTPGIESMPKFHRFTLTDKLTMKIATSAVRKSQDRAIRGIEWNDRIVNGALTRIVTVKSKHGKHKIFISHASKKVVSREYQEFPQADTMSIPALAYPVYEEVESNGTLLTRKPVVLTHVYKTIPQTQGDVYAPLKTRRYLESDYSPILGSTPEGRAQGYWSMGYIKEQAAKIRANLPQVENSYANGLLLQGEFATINIHPDAFTAFKGINFPAKASAPLLTNWVPTMIDGQEVYEMIPGSAFYGKPLTSETEVLTRTARRLPDNDPLKYINDGFDEIQVYYAINTLMEELHARGFADPEISTRPFNAFLFNPDVEYRDNAYYTDDTINFTTYSAKQPNMARDNSTIWHELGHGIMDRLMGDTLQLADTGGLSEGMADFVAALVVEAVTHGQAFPGSNEFRIINKTGFFLTNEVHDDGESYGGAMKDFLDAALARDGEAGLHKVTDVILEAMRLCRDHPALTASDWFNHVLFADQLGRPGVRAPGELSDLLLTALNGRNFSLDGSSVADFKLMNSATQSEIVANSEGSRQKPLKINVAPNATTHFDLTVKLKSSKEYAFQYPVQVKVEFEKGALQGAVHWIGKEKGPAMYTLNSEADTLHIPLDVSGKCDQINRQDGSCVDYAYVQILNPSDLNHPRAKKRFYVQIKNP